MMERVLRLLPWYSPQSQARRASRTEEVHHRAIRARISAERVVDDYTAAESIGPSASRAPQPPRKP